MSFQQLELFNGKYIVNVTFTKIIACHMFSYYDAAICCLSRLLCLLSTIHPASYINIKAKLIAIKIFFEWGMLE